MSDQNSVDQESFIKRACELAREAGKRGDGPYGSVLVIDDEIVMEASNHENTSGDLSKHAELTLARRAQEELEPKVAEEAVLYTSTEPCPMCSTGIMYANLNAVVFSVSGQRASELRGGNTTGIPCNEIFNRFNTDIDVYGPVLEKEGIAVHEEF